MLIPATCSARKREKLDNLKQYVSEETLSSARQRIIDIMEPALKDIYSGPFGVDMMIASKDGQLELVSCIELNLRRTMGHVASWVGQDSQSAESDARGV